MPLQRAKNAGGTLPRIFSSLMTLPRRTAFKTDVYFSALNCGRADVSYYALRLLTLTERPKANEYSHYLTKMH